MKIGFSAFLVLSILTVGGVGGYFLSGPENAPLQVLITLESSVPIETQLYYDTGKGFNEGESLKQAIYQANVPVTLDFDIPDRKLNGLRFDPGRSHARIKIFEILIQNNRKGMPFAVPLDSMTAARDIKSLQYDGKAIIVETTEAAQDPILLLGRIVKAPESSILKTLLFSLGGTFAALALALFILWVYRNSFDSNELNT